MDIKTESNFEKEEDSVIVKEEKDFDESFEVNSFIEEKEVSL